MDHPRPFDEPEQIVEEGTPLPRMTGTGDEKVMNDTIGIDIPKDHPDTHRLSDGKAKRFTNDRTGLKTLKNRTGPQCRRVVHEPAGRCHRDPEARLSKTAHAMVKVNPKRARRFAEAVGQSAKTDRNDAELPARMGAMPDLKASPLRDEPMNDLREVHVARSALIKDQTACRNRLCGARNTLVKAQLKTGMRRIARQLARLDAGLKKRIREDAKLAGQFEILRSIPCRRAMLIEMPEIGTLTPGQAAALAGLAPFVRTSGKWTARAKIGGGRAGLRQALYMPALVAARCNSQLTCVYKALRQKGRKARVALVAIMRKLIILANTLIRENRQWSKIKP